MTQPIICRSVVALRNAVAAARQKGQRLAMVPTMGALHSGHIALMRHALSLADVAIASIFVNPTQFAPNEDFDRYPRKEAEDIALLAEAGVGIVFAPTADVIYGPLDATRIQMDGPALGLETEFRPHFFGGVATVVSRLLLSALPDVAIFGEKDYQQLMVIRRMVDDLKIPVEIVGAPTIREQDGLALSSRNAYLSAQERALAPMIHRSLQEAAAAIRAGTPADAATRHAAETLRSNGFRPDYVAARNAQTLAPLTQEGEPVRLLAAAWLGKTRLIDNIPG